MYVYTVQPAGKESDNAFVEKDVEKKNIFCLSLIMVTGNLLEISRLKYWKQLHQHFYD